MRTAGGIGGRLVGYAKNAGSVVPTYSLPKNRPDGIACGVGSQRVPRFHVALRSESYPRFPFAFQSIAQRQNSGKSRQVCTENAPNPKGGTMRPFDKIAEKCPWRLNLKPQPVCMGIMDHSVPYRASWEACSEANCAPYLFANAADKEEP